MNIRKFFLAVVLAAPLLAPVRAFNVTDGIYTFTANPGQPTGLDGSWVKFSGDQIVDWTMLDPVQAAANGWIVNQPGYDASYLLEFPPLTPANSKVVSLDTYPNGTGPDAFNFRIASPNTATSNEGSQIWYFSGQNNLNNFSALYDGITYNNPEPFDPEGVWTRSAANVPDAASTGTLLLFGLAAFTPLKRLARR